MLHVMLRLSRKLTLITLTSKLHSLWTVQKKSGSACKKMKQRGNSIGSICFQKQAWEDT